MADRFQVFSWSKIRSFVTHGSDLKRLPLVTLCILATAIVAFVFWAAIEQRSSTIVEWLLNPDHAINFTADWRSDHPYGVAVTIVDIDDASFQAWGRPAWTPRDKLFDLIDALDRRGAAAIVVDVDLTSGPTIDEVSVAKRRLDDYISRPRKPGAQPPPLIFVRKLWIPTKTAMVKGVQVPSHGNAEINSAYSDALRRLNDTINADRSAELPQTIWASALFNSEINGSIRFWRVIEAACDQSPALGFPSVGLVTAALLADQNQPIAKLRLDANAYAVKFCGSQSQDRTNPTDIVAAPPIADDKDIMPWLALRKEAVRLPFLFWPDPQQPFRFGTARSTSGQIVPLVEILSARDLLKKNTVGSNLFDSGACSGSDDATDTCSRLKGRVVAIGASHIDSSDNYFTPLGSMPGVYILANTIAGSRDTLLRNPSWFQSAAVWSILLFLSFMLLVSRLRAAFAVIAASLVAIAFLTVISGWVGISTTATYHSLNASIVMLAIFLATGSFFADIEKWLRAITTWIVGRWRNPSA